jgi:hypothetical protein
MTMQFSVTVRDARAEAIEAAIGVSPIMRLRAGAAPASCVATDAGAILAEMVLPSDWMATVAAGVKAKAGTWQDLAADAAGTVGHFRIYDSTGTTCHIQGTVTITGGGGDLTLDNPVLAVGQQVTITSFALTEGNA